MSSHHRKEALEQISCGLKLKFLEFMKLYGKTGFPPELDVSTKGFSAAKTSSTSFKESVPGTTSTMGTSSTSFKEDEIQDDLDVLSSSSSSDESDEGQNISDLRLGLELKELEQQNHIDETESSSEMAALEDLVVEEAAERDTPKKRGYGCTGMKGVSRRIDSKNGTVSYQARPGFQWLFVFASHERW